MLDGEAVVRTPNGERATRRGDVVHFAPGASGAHQVINRSESVVRYVMVAAHGTMDAIEYVDEGRVIVYSHRPSLLQEGGLWMSHSVPNEGRPPEER